MLRRELRALLAMAGVLTFTACEAKDREQAKVLADEAARQAGQGVDAAREGSKELADEAARKAEQGVDAAREGSRKLADEAARQAEQGVDAAREGVDAAREGIADARDRYEVDARIEEAKRHLDENMDAAAESFEELAASSKKQATELGEKLAVPGEGGLVIAEGEIVCEAREADRLCRIDPALVAKLAEDPRQLARDVSLWPKEGHGLELVRVGAGGFAMALGLQERDVLVELNGVKLDSFDAISSLDEALAGTHETKLVYERDGQAAALVVMQQAPTSG